MPINKLERVMWRLRSRNKNKNLISNIELRRCIILECGYSEATYSRVRRSLILLGWLSKWKTRQVRVNDVDLTNS